MSQNASSARLLNSIGPYLFIRIICHFCAPFLLSPICRSRRSKEQLPLGLTSMHLYCFVLPRIRTLPSFLGTCRIVLSKHLPFHKSRSKKDNCLHVPVISAARRCSFVICCHLVDLMPSLSDLTVHNQNQQKIDTFVLQLKKSPCFLSGYCPS